MCKWQTNIFMYMNQSVFCIYLFSISVFAKSSQTGLLKCFHLNQPGRG